MTDKQIADMWEAARFNRCPDPALLPWDGLLRVLRFAREIEARARDEERERRRAESSQPPVDSEAGGSRGRWGV